MTTTIKIKSRMGFSTGNYIAIIENNKIICIYEKPRVAKSAYLSQNKMMGEQKNDKNSLVFDGNNTITQIFQNSSENELVKQSIEELDSIMKYNGPMRRVSYEVIKNG